MLKKEREKETDRRQQGLYVGFIVMIVLNVLFLLSFFLQSERQKEYESARYTSASAVPNIQSGISKESGTIPQDGESDVEQAVRLVSKHVLLPEGDVTVATILDIDSLRKENPYFFVYAKNGDKLLYYPHGIIIYDPVLDRIVDVVRLFPKK